MSKRQTKMMFIACLIIAGTIFTQMGLYVLSMFAGWDMRFNLVVVCHNAMKAFGLAFLKYALDALVFSTLLLSIWKMGTQCYYSIRMKKTFKQYTHHQLTREMNETYGGSIQMISYPAPIAVTMGFFRPKIVLSTGLREMLSDDEFEAVVHHEMYHKQHRDPLTVFIVSFFASIMWYMPILRWVQEQYKMAKELLADEYAIHQQGSSVDLGSALLKMLKAGRQMKMPFSYVSFADTSVNYRIHYILDPLTEFPLNVPLKSAVTSLSIFSIICLLFIYALS
ncbi:MULTISPECIES: M56 family metallopeptidase [Bacillaceae]|uniref:Peptidase M56 n=1 Tax=Domibacillus aminovorans TaxID=29332 RepID=A0A177KN13_9BACI|nr:MULTISPECIES: M56 family metallopeptidase [Bacillaceae]OAH54762.1 peptidase M56 [Domibacillus aminovorans]